MGFPGDFQKNRNGAVSVLQRRYWIPYRYGTHQSCSDGTGYRSSTGTLPSRGIPDAPHRTAAQSLGVNCASSCCQTSRQQRLFDCRIIIIMTQPVRGPLTAQRQQLQCISSSLPIETTKLIKVATLAHFKCN